MDAQNLIEYLTMNPHIAVLITDNRGYIIFINNTYLKILQREYESTIGQHVSKITPQTRTMTVLKTGKAIIGYNFSVNDHRSVASSVPLIKNDKIVGCFAYSLFLDIWDGMTTMENLVHELNIYKNEINRLYVSKYTFDNIIGNSRELLQAKILAERIAAYDDTSVLITGETGTGKELFAQAIHSSSSRSRFPIVRINCAAIPENLIEAELFGYEDGAYTGAKKSGKPGKFEIADGGSIFLDEVGEMPLSMQSKLLVVLQEKEMERLGGNKTIRVNVRIITATNRNLAELVKQGLFREDLYYRLNVVQLEIPPLRKRLADLPLLAEYLLEQLNHRLKTDVHEISPSAMDKLRKYAWPGNVRELEHSLERAMILADITGCKAIYPDHLAMMGEKAIYQISSTGSGLKDMTEEFEKRAISMVLEECGYDKIETARRLDIDASSLYRKIKRYGISPEKTGNDRFKTDYPE